MKIFFLVILFFLFVLFGLARSPWAAAYYVDYENGSDSNDGRSEGHPWKHVPGDTDCGGTCASTVPAAGDTFYFKKGVTYVGQINFSWSGNNPASGTTGTITNGGVFADTNASFIGSGVQAGDYIYIYNNSPTGAYLENVGLWTVASVESAGQLTLASYNGPAHLAPELAYKVIRLISLSSTPSWGSGDAVISGNNTLGYIVRPQGNYFRMAGIKLIDTAFPPEFPAASCTNIPQGAIWHNNSGIGHIYENLTFDHVWAGEFVNGLSYSVIRNNTVNDFGGIGLTGGTYSLMEGNVLTNGMSSIRGAGKYSVVRYNRIIDSNRSSAVYCGNHADGIGPLFSPAAEPGGNQYGWIYGNYISNTVQGIFLEYNNNGTSHWTMHSNVLVGHYGAGGSGACAICIDSAPDTKIYNNTIFGINGSQGWASLKFRHKKGEEVAGGQMAGLRGAAVWFLRKTERSVDEVRPRVNFLRELEG